MDQEQVDVEEKALRYIAKAADGSMRDGLSLLDQCIAFHIGEKLTFDMALDVLGAVDTGVFSRLVREIMARNVAGCIQLLEEIVMQGRELGQLATDFTWYLRNLLLAKSSDNMEDVLDVSSENLAQLKEEAQMIENDTLIRYIRIFSELSNQLKYATQKRVLLEVALIKLCKPAMEVNQDSLLDRIRAVEEQLENGVQMQSPKVVYIKEFSKVNNGLEILSVKPLLNSEAEK
jgi:DNA polymerase-3 subunit gamma/tau